MKSRRRISVLALSALLALPACAARRPVLYPNERLRSVGSAVAEQDIDVCLHQAENYLGGRGRGGEIAGDAAAEAGGAATVGAAAGAAGGAVLGHAARGAAVGAAGGAASGATRGLLRGLFRRRDPDPAYQNFVTRCLREKGYETIGWK